MSRSSQDPSHSLAYARTCGFCERRPTIVWLRDDNFVVGCESGECNARPRTEPRSGGGDDDRAFDVALDAAVAEWNRGARHQLRMLG